MGKDLTAIHNGWKFQAKSKKKQRHWTVIQRSKNIQNRLEHKIKDGKRLFWAVGPEAAHFRTRSENRTEPDKIDNDYILKPYIKRYLPRKEEKNYEELYLAETVKGKNLG